MSVCFILLLSYPSHNVLQLAGACLCPLCHCGRQPYMPRLVGGRRGGGQSYVAPRSRSPPTGRRRDSLISSSLFSHGPPLCAGDRQQSQSSPDPAGKDSATFHIRLIISPSIFKLTLVKVTSLETNIILVLFASQTFSNCDSLHSIFLADLPLFQPVEQYHQHNANYLLLFHQSLCLCWC